MSEKKIIHLDASILKLSACDMRMLLALFEGYTEPLPFNDTQYGSAYHLFMSTMFMTNGDFGKATIAANQLFAKPCIIRQGKKHLTQVHLNKTCFDSWEHLQKQDDFEIYQAPHRECIDDHDSTLRPLVEVNFSIPVYEDDLCKIYLSGTMDKIGKIKGGCNAIGDYKTHSLYAINRYTVAEYFAQYELSLQLFFYYHCLHLLAKQNPNSIFAEICKTRVAIFIDGVFIHTKSPTEFHRSNVEVPRADILSEFTILLDEKILSIAALYAQYVEDPKSFNRDGIIKGLCSDGKYLCKFNQVCAAVNPVARAHVLKNNYKQRLYNPLMFGKE